MRVLHSGLGALASGWRGVRRGFSYFTKRDCLVDFLPPYLRTIAESPVLALLALVLLYVIWLPFGALFAFLAGLVTTPVVAVFGVVLVILVGRFIARMMVFPGSVAAISKSMEREVAQRMRLETKQAIHKMKSALMVLYSFDRSSSMSKGHQAKAYVSAVESMSMNVEALSRLRRVLKAMEVNNSLGSHASVVLSRIALVQDLCSALLRALGQTQGTAQASFLTTVISPGVHVDAGGSPTACLSIPHVLEVGPVFVSTVAAEQGVARVLESEFACKDFLVVLHACLSSLQDVLPWIEILPQPNDWFSAKEVGTLAHMSRSAIAQYTKRHHRTWKQFLLRKAKQAAVAEPKVCPHGCSCSTVARNSQQERSVQQIGCADVNVADILEFQPSAEAVGKVLASVAVSDEDIEADIVADEDAAVAAAASSGTTPPGRPQGALARIGAAVAAICNGLWLFCEHGASLANSFMFARSFPSPVCGFDFMRTDFMLSTHAQHMWLCGSTRNAIDAMYVPSPLRKVMDTHSPSTTTFANIGTASPSRQDRWLSALARYGVPRWLLGCLQYGWRDGATEYVDLLPESQGVDPGSLPADTPPTSLRAYAASAPAVVLLFNPNAGFYEFAHGQSEWIGFYGGMGFDVVLYNYRGYGRSAGSPTPSLLKQDAEIIVKFLQTDLGAQKIIVHGESIGGVAACHVAAVCRVDVIVADRNFDTLPRTASALVGKPAGAALQVVTRWTASNAAAYCAAAKTCNKILCFDPRDDVIRWPSGLALGVAAAVQHRNKLVAPSWLPCSGAHSVGHAAVQSLAAELWVAIALLADAVAPALLSESAGAEGNAFFQPPAFRAPPAGVVASASTPSYVLGADDPLRALLAGEPFGAPWKPQHLASLGSKLLARSGIYVAENPESPISTSVLTNGILKGEGLALLQSCIHRALLVVKRVEFTLGLVDRATETVSKDQSGAGRGSSPTRSLPSHHASVEPLATAEGVAAMLPSSLGDAAQSLTNAVEQSTNLTPIHSSSPAAQTRPSNLKRYPTVGDAAHLPTDLRAAGAEAVAYDTAYFKSLLEQWPRLFRSLSLTEQSIASLHALGCLCGMTNGLGSTLGEAAIAGGVSSIAEFIGGGIAWGWGLQHGEGAATLGLDEAGHPRTIGRTLRFLLLAGESGLETTARRLGTLASCIPRSDDHHVLTAYTMATTAIQKLSSIMALQSQPPPQGALDRTQYLKDMMQSPKGLCVPLSCGHNAAWEAEEKQLVAGAIVTSIFGSSQSVSATEARPPHRATSTGAPSPA